MLLGFVEGNAENLLGVSSKQFDTCGVLVLYFCISSSLFRYTGTLGCKLDGVRFTLRPTVHAVWFFCTDFIALRGCIFFITLDAPSCIISEVPSMAKFLAFMAL